MKVGVRGSLQLEEFATQGAGIDGERTGWWRASGERLWEKGVVGKRRVGRFGG